MACYHEVKGHPGVLRRCRTDPCHKHPYGADIHADTIEEAQKIYERCIANKAISSPLMKSRGISAITPVSGNGRPISPNDIDSSAEQLSSMVTEQQWEDIQSATDTLYATYKSEYHKVIGTRWNDKKDIPLEDYKKVEDKLTNVLVNSQDPSFIAYRKYLGDDVRPSELSALITRCPLSLSRRADPRFDTVQRCILTRTSNDMDKKHVIATVLYFGGRCCYCGRPIKKGGQRASKRTATADHLDPIKPDDNRIPGETKFGNVVLCCARCNSKKSNLPMKSWLVSTKILNDDNAQRVRAYKCVLDFRKYALYSPMSEKKAAVARAEIAKVQEYKDRNPDDMDHLMDEILMAVAKIREAD
jgi:5-methylcytosine-specific restriction endonuclease McrA